MIPRLPGEVLATGKPDEMPVDHMGASAGETERDGLSGLTLAAPQYAGEAARVRAR
jgi:hypothetical protein